MPQHLLQTASRLTRLGQSAKHRVLESGSDIAQLRPDFATLRVALWVCLVAAIAVPVTYLVFDARSELQRQRQLATDVSVRMVRVAEEHALKLLDLNTALQARIAELVRNRPDDAIRSDTSLYDRFQELGAPYPQVAHIALYDEHGALLASSRTVSPLPVSIAQQPQFQVLLRGQHALYMSDVEQGPLSQEPVFSLSSARVGANGRFLGVISIALRPAYFARFYRELMGDGTPVAITLLRDDGAILARWSPGKNIEPLAHVRSALTPLLPHLPGAGVTAPRLSVEGTKAIFAYRRVAGYPVLVVVAYPVPDIYAKWRAHVLFAAALTLLPCTALVLLLGLCLMHLGREERAWDVVSARVERQRSLEAAQKETLRLQALGKLAGSVAHDFNNLLMTLSANLEVSRRLSSVALPQHEAMERALHRGMGLTRRLLGVVRKQPLRSEVLSLQSWGKDFGLVRASLRGNIELRVDIPADAWPIEVDPMEFELVILNIAMNARDAIAAEGWFSIAARNVVVDAMSPLPIEGEFLCITLTDNGMGMAPEVMRHAFEPLFTTKPEGKGTGLGLAHVRSFCEQAGGTVQLESTCGAGTTLKLYLPRATQASPVQASPVQAPEAPGPSADTAATSLSILLVEDNDAVAEAEAAVLQILGHTVHREPEANSALARLQERVPFDCVVSDIQMPGTMNGIDLARTVRNDFPDLPVVLVTGYAKELERARQTGFTVLPKPFSIDSLKHVLMRAVATRAAYVSSASPAMGVPGRAW